MSNVVELKEHATPTEAMMYWHERAMAAEASLSEALGQLESKEHVVNALQSLLDGERIQRAIAERERDQAESRATALEAAIEAGRAQSERLEAHDADMERERNECMAVLNRLECYLHLLAPALSDSIRGIVRRHQLVEDAKARLAYDTSPDIDAALTARGAGERES